MPTASVIPAILNVVLLIILLLALGLSGTAFGLFAHNNGGGTCFLNFSINIDSTFDSTSGNRKLCNTSLACYIIATICIAVATSMEFNRLVYGKAVNIVGKIIEIALLATSGVFLLIGGVSVAVGWAQTCKNVNNILDFVSLSCNDVPGLGYVHQELVGSAVCALLGMIFTTTATLVAVLNAILTMNASSNLEEKAPIMK